MMCATGKAGHPHREWARDQAASLNTSLRYSTVSGHLVAFVAATPCETCGEWHIEYRDRGVSE